MNDSATQNTTISIMFGYYLVDRGVRYWHPNLNLRMTEEDQYEHNTKYVKGFNVVEVLK